MDAKSKQRRELIIRKAVVLFEGRKEAAMRWLHSPRPALGNPTPLELAKTKAGAKKVEDLIARLEDGVFS